MLCLILPPMRSVQILAKIIKRSPDSYGPKKIAGGISAKLAFEEE